MNRKEQLKLCKICIHRKNDIQQGILCGLTNEKATFVNSCPDYKFDSDRVLKEEKDEIYRLEQQYGDDAAAIKNGKSTTWIYFTTALTILIIVFKLGRVIYNNTESSSQPSRQDIKFRQQLDKISRKQSPKIIKYISASNRKSQHTFLKKDSILWLHNKKIKLRLSRKYNVSSTDEFSETPIIANYRGYHFFYNKTKKDINKTLNQQWEELRLNYLRNVPGAKFSYNILDKSTISNINIEEINFTISNSYYPNIYGVAKLVEINNDRYFFQFAYKQKAKDHNGLRKYLNRYVKIRY